MYQRNFSGCDGIVVRTNTFALFFDEGFVCRVSEGAVAQMMERTFAHRGVFAAEAEVVKRRRKDAIS